MRALTPEREKYEVQASDAEAAEPKQCPRA
jgi:hypothetical protein